MIINVINVFDKSIVRIYDDVDSAWHGTIGFIDGTEDVLDPHYEDWRYFKATEEEWDFLKEWQPDLYEKLSRKLCCFPQRKKSA